MTQSPSFDDITVARLRELGSLKWSQFPGKLGAFVAEMDYGVAPPVARALHEAVDTGSFGYLPEQMAGEMGRATAGWLTSRYGWDVPAERIRPLGDVLAGLQVAIEHFSTPGSKIIVPTPCYMPFLTVPGALGRELIEVPMAVEHGRYVYDLDALDAAFRDGGELLVLCNPHNPIGRVLLPTEMEAVAEVVERHGGRVFSDEIHAPLVYPGHRHVPYASLNETTAGHTLTAVSASKAWNLPGLKCAQMVLSNEADTRRWPRVSFFAEHGASNLGVIANTAAYREGKPWLEEVLLHLDGNRRLLGDLLAERIPEIGYTAPEGTYLAFLDCRALELGENPAEFFLEKADVAMTDGVLCGQAGKGFVRYTFATPRAVVEETVERMAGALRNR